MVRSVIAVAIGYLVFSASTVALFKISGQDPHLPADVTFMALSVLYGVFFATLAGFVAAWLAKRWEFEHSLAVACLIAVAGAISLLTQPGKGSTWTQLAVLLVMAPSAMLGGYLRLQQVGVVKK